MVGLQGDPRLVVVLLVVSSINPLMRRAVDRGAVRDASTGAHLGSKKFLMHLAKCGSPIAIHDVQEAITEGDIICRYTISMT